MATSLCLISGLISSFLSLALIAASIASSQWLSIRTHLLQMDVGLMRHCVVGSSPFCGDMDELHDLVNPDFIGWFRSMQAVYLLHCVGALITFCLYILYAVRFFENKGSFKLVTAFSVFTLACGAFSISVFGSYHHKMFAPNPGADLRDVSSFGAGFYTAVVGVAVTFVVTILAALEASRAAELIQNARSRVTLWASPYTLFVEQEA